MSYADTIFINMCKDILENGTSTEGEKVRPHWPDGASAYTIKKFGVVNRYDLTKEFPIMTLRKTALKSADISAGASWTISNGPADICAVSGWSAVLRISSAASPKEPITPIATSLSDPSLFTMLKVKKCMSNSHTILRLVLS